MKNPAIQLGFFVCLETLFYQSSFNTQISQLFGGCQTSDMTVAWLFVYLSSYRVCISHSKILSNFFRDYVFCIFSPGIFRKSRIFSVSNTKPHSIAVAAISKSIGCFFTVRAISAARLAIDSVTGTTRQFLIISLMALSSSDESPGKHKSSKILSAEIVDPCNGKERNFFPER